MQILHLHWSLPHATTDEASLFLWDETSDVMQPTRDRRRKSPQPHPFVWPRPDLIAWLRSLTKQRSYHEQIITLWLPSGRYGPQPSPPLIHDWERDTAPPEMFQWEVSGVQLPATQALPLLIALNQGELLAPQMKLGPDARYWLLVTNFVLEVLAQQKVRPTLVDVRDSYTGVTSRYESRWQPLLDGDDEARRLGELAAHMPAICRAATGDPAQGTPARLLLDTFLNHMTDAAARTWSAPQADGVSFASTNPARAWVRALLDSSPAITAPRAQIQHLLTGYRAWERMLYMAGTATYRVAFRLEAPAQQKNARAKKANPKKENDVWQLHYLLQARDDASLLVPAAAVWKTGGDALTVLDRRFDRPQETLLTGLGYAGRFFTPIRRSLDKRQPTAIALTTEEAYTFLRHCAPQLQRSGFGLLVPPWWNQPGTRLGVRLQLATKSQTPSAAAVSSGHLNLENLVHYRWELSLGDTTLTRAEFDALVNLKTPLVQIRGQWVQLDPEQIEQAIQFWNEQALEGEASLLDAMQMGLGAAESTQAGLPVDGVEMDRWLEEWLAQLQGEQRMEELPQPAGLQATLRPYQRYGYSWLDFARRWGMGVILADDMGLGKTIQTLAMVERMKKEEEGLPAPVLLVAPTSVVANWAREAARFTPGLQTLVHQGGDRLQGDYLVQAAHAADMVLTSYAIVRRDGDTLQGIDWHGVVLDEAQNIKNANTKQAQTIRRLPADFRLALTGTPVENRLSELWSIFHFLNPGYLGSQKQFRTDFSIPIEKHNDRAATQRLRQLTQPFILRRVKTDPTVIQDLPDKQEMKEYYTLSEEQATLYEAVVREALAAIESEGDAESIKRRGLVLSMLMQLKQVCNHPAQYLHQGEGYDPTDDVGRSGKLNRLYAMLDEVLAEGDRTLTHWCVFTREIAVKNGGSAMKTELRFTDERVPHVAILWDQASTFRIRIDGQTVDSFQRYGDSNQSPCTLEQAQQTAGQWFDEVCAVQI